MELLIKILGYLALTFLVIGVYLFAMLCLCEVLGFNGYFDLPDDDSEDFK